MRILLTGANGFIGSAVLARLRSEGHEVIAVLRNAAAKIHPLASELVIENIAQATLPEQWSVHLGGVDVVINCAGVLQDSPRDSTQGVHVSGVAALFAACARTGPRRIVHLSAIGVDRETPTPFSRSKREGEQALMAFDLDWVILRPSVVVGRGAYGGSALFRGLAALPILPVIPDTGPLQIVQRDDVVRTILFFIRPEAPAQLVLDLAGPVPLSLVEIVQAYRRWFGWPPARLVRLPEWLAAAIYRIGDAIALLGWRPPIRSTVRHEIRRGAIGDPAPWTMATGIKPVDFHEALAAEPASVQERWFARLYFLKPVVFGVFSLFWILTGLVSLGSGFEVGTAWMIKGGAGALSGLSVVLGAIADIVIGIGIAIRRTARVALLAAVALTLFYVVAGTILVPQLWADPLGPMLKIWPVLALNLVALAILEDR